MGFGELMLLAVGVSMDAFAVSICKGLAMKKATLKAGLTCGIWFGGFQALMPVIGFFLGMLFAEAIQAIDHWVAFVLLGIIGISMLREAFSKEEESHDADLSVKTMFVMAIATSIDALAVGISLAMAGDVNIWAAIALIGCFTCAFCTVGVKIGNIFGSKFESKAQIAGGLILIFLGAKILIEGILEEMAKKA
jgi:putative Mn2+ efflux pump MntP